MMKRLSLLLALLSASLGAHAQIGSGGISNGCQVGSTTIFGCYKVDGTSITVTNGVISSAGGSGAVSGVTFADGSTTPIFSIAGSPGTGAVSITETLATQLANLVFAGPTTGSAAQPTFRSLVSADIPNNAANTSGSAATATTAANLSGTPAVPNGTTATTQATADNTTKLATDAFVVATAGAGNTTGNAATATNLAAATTLPAGTSVTGTTAGSAQGSGKVGEVDSVACDVAASSTAVTGITVSNATPAIVTWPSTLPASFTSGIASTCPLMLSTLTANTAPTVIQASTTVPYWLISGTVSGNTFQVASSDTNAIAGTALSGAGGSATSTFTASMGQPDAVSGNYYAGAEISLAAGTYYCGGAGNMYNSTTSATTSQFNAGLNTSLVGRPLGAKYQNYGSIGIISGTYPAVLETVPIASSLLTFSGTTTLYLSDDVASGAPTNFTLGGFISCLRIY